ncbi:unnamed protein product [Caenorhabditis angaria]|uniref:G-protein coupled receptors family 1 profile domain-containing protein n=1 Tax=Caenorhabditis angaria TaxID=860376 RepID=A0A9P1IUL4_9PELO|nr:unnamed protein product [Caenorhabditis angaria]
MNTANPCENVEIRLIGGFGIRNGILEAISKNLFVNQVFGFVPRVRQLSGSGDLRVTAAIPGARSSSMHPVVIVSKSSPTIGKYKYLLVTFSSFNIFATCLEVITPVSTESFEFSFIVFVGESLIYRFRDLAQFLVSLRCSIIAYTFGLISIHFLYRYFAICKIHLTNSFFKPKFIFLTIFLVFAYGSTWLLIIAKWMWPDISIRKKLDQDFLDKYNESTVDLPFIVADYGNPEFSKNGLIGIALATIVSIASLSLDTFLAIKIYLALKILNLSENVKKVHRILLITLIAQTAIPSIFTFGPCLIVWLAPFFESANSNSSSNSNYYINSIIVPIINIYPIFDPIIIIFALVDYREAILKIFGWKNNNAICYNVRSTFIETTCV